MYGGNYDTFMRTKMELDESQMKQYQWEQDQISHMKVQLMRDGREFKVIRKFLKYPVFILDFTSVGLKKHFSKNLEH